MTPREKAKELLAKCNNSACAVIASNEAIDVLEKLYNYIADEKALFKVKWEIIWWRDVRKEIERL